MPSIVAQCENLFGVSFSSFTELLLEIKGVLFVTAQCMPPADRVLEFIHDNGGQDEWSLSIEADGENFFLTNASALWEDDYRSFISNILEDSVKITLTISKQVNNGVINVYRYQAFVDFVLSRTNGQLLDIFVQMFELCGNHITLLLHDKEGTLQSQSITISDQLHSVTDLNSSRENQRSWCNEASVFFEKARYPLIPQDFILSQPTRETGFEKIISVFSKLSCMLSYVYVASSSSIHNETAMLSFSPSHSGNVYALSELADNDTIVRIFEWIYSDKHCVDRAAIARNIINLYCKTKESYLAIDDSVFASMMSDYQIYQKGHVDQYIDMKNKISDHIVECTKQIQELAHDFSDALRNNLVAILVFIMTVFLTDVYDIDKIMTGDISSSFIVVCWMLIGVSLIYMVVSVLNANEKWNWLLESYEDLKRNYSDLFVPQDVDEAFRNDESLKNAKKKYVAFRKKLCTIWIILLLFTSFATTHMTVQHVNQRVMTEQQVVEQTIDDAAEALPIETEASSGLSPTIAPSPQDNIGNTEMGEKETDDDF